MLVGRWVLARLRNRRFFSLADLNLAIAELVGELNARVMRAYGASRAELFVPVDAPTLRTLPAPPYASTIWKRCHVAPDYDVDLIDPSLLEIMVAAISATPHDGTRSTQKAKVGQSLTEYQALGSRFGAFGTRPASR